MKELTAILDCVEKRIDLLSLASEIIILSDCSAVTYLFHQSKSNAIMSRYLSRLNNYNIKILVRHKNGEHLTIADTLSRVFTIANNDTSSDEKVHHRQGILVKVPFPLGSIVNPNDIIEYIKTAPDQIVTATSDPKISKECQTMNCNNNTLLLDSKHSEPLSINQINTSMTKEKVLQQVKESLSFSIYAKAQKEEYPNLYNKLLTTKMNHLIIENGLILTKVKDNHFARLTPPSLRNKILSRAHLLGHYASATLKKVIQQTDTWPGIKRDCKDFVSTCLSCIWIRPPRGNKYRLGIPITGKPGLCIQIDLVSGLKPSNGYKFFATVICSFSRHIITFPLRNDNAEEIARNLEDKVFNIMGAPSIILCDGATNLGKSRRMQALCNLYNTSIKIRSPYSSRSLGLVERAHRTILDNIRSLSDSFSNSWVENLSLSTSIYNSIPHTATALTPFELRFGFKNRLFEPIEDIHIFKNRDADLDNHHTQLKNNLKTLHNTCITNDTKYKETMRQKYGGTEVNVKPGSFVVALNKTPAINEKLKLRAKYYGPFLVVEDLESTLIAENSLNGKTTYLHKSMIRPIPEKSVDKYFDLPLYAKQIFGEGFTFNSWKTLHNNKKLLDYIKRRNFNESHEYGIERPIQNTFTPILETTDEITKPVTQTQNSDDTSNDEINPSQPQITEPISSNRTIRFQTDQEPRRSDRKTKEVQRLNL